LAALVVDGLLGAADAGVKDGGHGDTHESVEATSVDRASVDSCQLIRTRTPSESTETDRAYFNGRTPAHDPTGYARKT
jgi:hypothetical protein